MSACNGESPEIPEACLYQLFKLQAVKNLKEVSSEFRELRKSVRVNKRKAVQ